MNSSYHRGWLVLVALLAAVPGIAQDSASRDWSKLPDFDALRQEIGWHEKFDEICGIADRPIGEMHEHMEADEWDTAVALSGRWLQSCPVDIRIHMYRSIAYQHLDNKELADLHSSWFFGLVDSVVASGDGKSLESAFVTISVMEEYDVLTALRLTPKNQSLVQQRDMFDVTDEQGNEHKIYFFPEAHWNRLSTIFP